jgi:hypothetical protein
LVDDFGKKNFNSDTNGSITAKILENGIGLTNSSVWNFLVLPIILPCVHEFKFVLPKSSDKRALQSLANEKIF